LNLEYAKNPQWADPDHTMIDLIIKWDTIDEELPFSATAEDVEAHGREIYNNALAGGYGEIAEYVPVVLSAEELADSIRAERNNLLAETDWMAMQDRTMSQAEKDYRQALRDITDQPTFPDSVVWPEL